MIKLIHRCPDCRTFLVPSVASFIEGTATEYSLNCMKCNKNFNPDKIEAVIENDLDIYEIRNLDAEAEIPVVLRVDNSTITFESEEQAKEFLQLEHIVDFVEDTNIQITKIDQSALLVDGDYLLTTNCILLDDNAAVSN